MERAPSGAAEEAAEGMVTDGMVSKGTLPDRAGGPGGDVTDGVVTEDPGIGGVTASGAESGGGATDGGGDSSGARAGPKVGEVIAGTAAGF